MIVRWPLLLRLLLIAVLIGYAGLLLRGLLGRPSLDLAAADSDFFSTLTGAAIIERGDAAQLYDLATQSRVQAAILPAPAIFERPVPFIHLPIFAIIFAPLYQTLGLGGSYLLWLAVSLAVVVVSFGLLRPNLCADLPANRSVTLALLFAGSYYPLFTSLLLGQVSALLLLGLIAGYRLFQRGRDGWAGVALATLLLKPPLLLLPLLVLVLLRRWSALLGLSVGGLVLYLLAVPWLGWGWPLAYFSFLLKLSGSTVAAMNPAIMQSWRNPSYLLFGSSPAATLVFVALSLPTIFAVLWLWRRAGWQPSSEGWSLAFAATVLGMVLTSYHLLPHDLTILILPALIVYRWRVAPNPMGQAARVWLAILLAGWLLAPTAYESLPLAILPTAAILGLLVYEVRKPTAFSGAVQDLTSFLPGCRLKAARYSYM